MNVNPSSQFEPGMEDTALFNVGQLLTRAAQTWPQHPAVAVPQKKGWQQVTYRELEKDSNSLAVGLAWSGITPNQRVAMLVPPGIDFIALVFALFKARANIILIDPGIGKKNLIKRLSDAEPECVIGIAKAQIARWIFRKQFPKVKRNFVVGRRQWPGCKSIEQLRSRYADAEFDYTPHADDDAAAIIFTSGSTGAPKGVAYSHRNFIHQAIEVRDYFGIEPGGADVSGFPLFALFNTGMGKTTVFPKMDFTRPADVSPPLFLEAAKHWKADQAFGSPALWNTVSRWCEKNKQTLPSIQRALSAGAPVPAHVLKRVKKIIAKEGEVYTPYGATEALPVACNSASVVLAETGAATQTGKGVCVGGHFPGIQWKVIEISDEPISSIGDVLEVPAGEIGELIVKGAVVTQQYVTRKDANALAKIKDGDRVWHRMGDLGYLDAKDRFWFCGRKTQRIRSAAGLLFTVPCESIVNTHPAIYRSALIGLPDGADQRPLIVAEPWPEHWPDGEQRKQRLLSELQELVASHELTKAIQEVRLLKKLPVDIRHNSKIFRERLTEMMSARD